MESSSLSVYESPVRNQLDLSACVGNALASDIEILANRAGQPMIAAPMFIYTTARIDSYYNSQLPDAGVLLSDGIKALVSYGVPSESAWPYDPAKVSTVPDAPAYAQASALKVTSYKYLGAHTDAALKQWKLAIAEGYPVVIGLPVTLQLATLRAGEKYTGFTTAGAVSLGYHAMVLDAFDDATGQFHDKNSYGTQFGDSGYMNLSYAVAQHDVVEAYVITQLSGMTILPLWAPSSAGPRIYLADGDLYKVANDNEHIYGASARGHVALIDGDTRNTTMDGNIQSLTIHRDLHSLDLLQSGNVLDVYFNGGLLATWPINYADDVIATDTGNIAVQLVGSVMYANGTAISSVAPTHI